MPTRYKRARKTPSEGQWAGPSGIASRPSGTRGRPRPERTPRASGSRSAATCAGPARVQRGQPLEAPRCAEVVAGSGGLEHEEGPAGSRTASGSTWWAPPRRVAATPPDETLKLVPRHLGASEPPRRRDPSERPALAQCPPWRVTTSRDLSLSVVHSAGQMRRGSKKPSRRTRTRGCWSGAESACTASKAQLCSTIERAGSPFELPPESEW